MTLVALYYNPPQQEEEQQQQNSHNPFHSTKWKKGLALLYSKYYNKRKHHKYSPTTAAAATEKVLCHDNKQQQHVKCEDLTAKEFAQITGIKIRSSSSNENLLDSEHQHLTTTTMTTATKRYAASTTVHIYNEPMTTQMTSISTCTEISSSKTTSATNCHRIWDSDFWKCNTTATTSSNSPAITDESTLILSRIHSASSTPKSSNTNLLKNNLTVPGVIQKGRFKIVVGQEDIGCEPVNQHVVFEWKRKRSNSSSTTLLTNNKKLL
ncbi:MAG: hypothetical protein EXX96DRAFT_576107 [Benjaminiella poitrasii]|nr:MAG: hypothetical protein EXX96DRAFT_576107 [Benjaminiella poitrasii]